MIFRDVSDQPNHPPTSARSLTAVGPQPTLDNINTAAPNIRYVTQHRSRLLPGLYLA